MSDLNTIAAFPNLGTDTAQIAMIATSFAAQTDFFARFAGLGVDRGLYNIGQAFALIGFLYLGMVHSSWRGSVLAPWFIVLMLMILGPSYTGSGLFFTRVVPLEHDGLVAPLDPLGQYTKDELIELQRQSSELGELTKKFKKPVDIVNEQFNVNNSLFMFGPQAAILHGMNNLLRDTATAFFAPGSRTFQDRIVAAQTLANAQTGDYRIGHIQAMFRSVCTAENEDWDRLFATTVPQMQQEFSKIYRKWAAKKLTFEDFIIMHLQFFEGQRNLENFVEEVTEVGDVSASNFGRFLSPALLLEDVWDRTLEQINTSSEGTRHSSSLAGVGPYAVTSGLGADKKFRQFAEAKSRADKEVFFQQVLLPILASEDAKSILNAEVSVILPISRAEGVDTGTGFFIDLFGGSDKISNCQEMHMYMHEVTSSLTKENLGLNQTAAEFATQQFRECKANGGELCEELNEISWSELSETQRIYLGYQYAKNNTKNAYDECLIYVVDNTIIDRNCTEELRKNEIGLELALVANVLRGDQIIANGILESTFAKLNQFRSPIREGLAEVGNATADLFVWLMSAFGGFAAGAYAAIMPLIISWGLAIIIIITPFIYMMGLIIPGWSLMILLTPLIGVLYLKSVEISFVLVKGVFEMFRQTIGVSGILSSDGYVTGIPEKSGILGFYDLILGIGYTSAFGISLFLLFGLRNPAGLAQQIGTSADKTAQISGGEVVKAAVAGIALTALPGKGIALGTKALAGTAKLASAGERVGLVPTEATQALSGLSATYARTRANSHSRYNADELFKQKQSNTPYSAYQRQAKAESTAALEGDISSQSKGSGNSALVTPAPLTYQVAPNGEILPVNQLDNAIDALAANIQKLASEVGDDSIALDRNGLSLSNIRGIAKRDQAAYQEDTTLATFFRVDALVQDGGLTENAINLGIERGIFEENFDPQTGQRRIRSVTHEGLNKQFEALHQRNEALNNGGGNNGFNNGNGGGGNNGNNGGNGGGGNGGNNGGGGNGGTLPGGSPGVTQTAPKAEKRERSSLENISLENARVIYDDPTTESSPTHVDAQLKTQQPSAPLPQSEAAEIKARSERELNKIRRIQEEQKNILKDKDITRDDPKG